MLVDKLIERVYGGDDPLKMIAEIRIAKTEKNYEDLISALRAKLTKKEFTVLMARTKMVISGQANTVANQITDLFRDAPIAPGSSAPTSWILRGWNEASYRIYRKATADGETKPVLDHPLFISGVLADVSGGRVKVDLCFQLKPDGRWHRKIIDRKTYGAKTDFAKQLAGCGARVTANNAGGVIQWVADYEHANMTVTPVSKTTERFGWVPGDNGYVLGAEHIGGGGDSVMFSPASDGDEQLAESVASGGSFVGWAKAMLPISQYRRVMVGVYAALAAPLIKPLSCHNAIIEWAGRTSCGKTTTLMLAASVWGRCAESDSTSLLASWDGTMLGLTERAATMCDMPLFVDDTKRARTYRGSSIVSSLIYALFDGRGRARGSVDGHRKIKNWRTVVLTTGEQRAVDYSKDGGTAARVLTLWGNPFEGESATIAKQIDEAKIGASTHYGHACPEFVRWVCANRSLWPEWRDRLALIKARAQRSLMGGEVASGVVARAAETIALLELTVELAHEALTLPWAPINMYDILAECVIREGSTASRDREAMKDIISVVSAKGGSFMRVANARYETINGGWLGIWDCNMPGPAFFTTALTREITGLGYEYNSTIRQWRERGWVAVGKPDGWESHPELVIITAAGLEAGGGKTHEQSNANR